MCLSHSGVASGEGEKVWSLKLPSAPPDPLCLLSVEANEWWINLGSPLANWDDPPQNLPEVCIPLWCNQTQILIVHTEQTWLNCGIFFVVAHLESSVSYCRNIYCSLFCGAEAKQYILKYNTLSVHFNVHKQGDCTHKSSLICVCRLPAYRHWSHMDFGSVPQHKVEGRHPFQKQTFILCNLDFFQWKHHILVRLY